MVKVVRDGFCFLYFKKICKQDLNRYDLSIGLNYLGRKFTVYKNRKVLKELFTNGRFIGPRNNIMYNRTTTWGHLGMENAIVDYLMILKIGRNNTN